MPQPNFFIVGMPRSGTTALHSYLKQHPEIFLCEPKAPNHFCRDLHQANIEFTGRTVFSFGIKDRSEYLKLFDKATGFKAVGEASAFYSQSKTSAQEIHEFDPNAKIIIVLRNPVDFLSSLHGRWVVRTVEDEPDFEKALNLEPERRQGKNLPANVKIPAWVYYSDWVAYADVVSRFLKEFGPDQVKVLVLKEYIKELPKTYAEVCEFLGVDPKFEANFEKVNSNMAPKSKLLNRILQNQIVYRSLRVLIPRSVRSGVKDLAMKLFWKETKRKAMAPEKRAELIERFQPEIKKIAGLLDKDLVSLWQ